MTVEQQVCTLEQAKRLKELGIIQTGIFIWLTFRNESSPKEQCNKVYSVIDTTGKESHYERNYLKDVQFFSAFTVAELGLMLGHAMQRVFFQYNSTFVINTEGMENAKFPAYTHEAHARAALLIHIIENNYVHIDHINYRLTF